MEPKDDDYLVKMAVEQLTDSRRRKASSDGADEDDDDDRNLLLISRLLSQEVKFNFSNLLLQLQMSLYELIVYSIQFHITQLEEKKLQQKDDDDSKMEEPSSSSSLVVDDQGNQDGAENGSRNDEIILRELRKVKKQNFITHCLLSAMIVITLTWQISEVSMIFKLKDRITNPFRSISQLLGFKKDTDQLPLLKQLPAFDLKQDKDDDDDD